MFVWYFSQDLKALDTIDFWAGTFMIFIQGSLMIILFAWVLGSKKGSRRPIAAPISGSRPSSVPS